jgi:hypothetical protein
MNDDEYYQELMTKASPAVVLHSWQDCVAGFKQADKEMGSAFHCKLGWMNKAAQVYFSDKGKNAGFVEVFANDTKITYDYAVKLNVIRKTFQDHDPKNFSLNALRLLASSPKELQDDFLSSEEPVKVNDVKEAKEGYKKVGEKGNEDLRDAVSSGKMKPREAAKKALSRAEEAVIEFNGLTDEEKLERLGGAKPIDAAYQRKLDETLGKDFNPSNAATGILISLNRLRLFGGKKEIEYHMLAQLHRSVRMQKYEAEALLMLAEVINKNYNEIAGYMETKPNLKVVN